MGQHDNYGTGEEESPNSIFAIRGDLDGDDAEQFNDFTRYIGLMVGEEEFVLPIVTVCEILMPPRMTYIPGAPRYIAGVINLRGTIIPAINMRQLVGLPTQAFTNASRLVVVKVRDFMVCLIVDGITYVIPLAEKEIEQTALSSGSLGSQLIAGIANRGDKVNGILSIEKIVSAVSGVDIDTLLASDTEEAA